MVLLEMNHVKKSFDGNGVLKDISLKGRRQLRRKRIKTAEYSANMRPRQNYIRSGNVSDWCSRILTFFPIIR